jgi:glycosyltransferase involved in cell wall biosynthesis
MESTMAGVRTRPRLLFLCQTLPYPPDGGVWIRTYHVLRLLSREFEITALCFERARASDHAAGEISDSPGLARFASVEVFALPHRHSRLRFVWNHVRSAACGRVYTTYVYQSREFQQRLTQLLKSDDFDLVHIDSLDLARYLPACRNLPVVCVHHDLESNLLRRRAALDPAWYRRVYLRHQAALMQAVEREHGARVALNVTVSEHDRVLLTAIAPGSRAIVVPNGVDIDAFYPCEDDGTGVAYIGGTTPFPNRDALDFFSTAILPRLRAAGVEDPVRWIGHATEHERRLGRERHGIELTGYVNDVRPLMSAAACHIVPLRVGGGTRLKILNAWAMGKAVVSTRIGCEGLAARDGDNILIRDEPAAFTDGVLEVLRNVRLRRALGTRGRATVERLYSWEVIGHPMLDAYLGIARGHNQNSRAAKTAVRAHAHLVGG